MTTRVRQQQSAAPTQQRRIGAELPPYETPAFSLNPSAERALAQLTQIHSLKKLDEQLAEAQAALSNNAAEINERLAAKEKATKKRKDDNGQRSSVDAENGDEIEQSLNELRDKVDRMTQRMDESMRKTIDGQHSVQFIKESVAAIGNEVRANASTQASTQQVWSQRQIRRETGIEDDEEDEGDESYQDFMPTDPAAGTQGQPAPIEAFRSKMDDAKTRYQSHSLTARYAENNDYRDFRRLVHDAKHGEDEVPLAHHSEWFDEGEAPAPGVTTRARANEDEDEDDDIAVARTTISTKCPLTLQEFKKPVCSRKCPHSFESEAILSMISTSTGREGREPAVQCPVSGCSQRLTSNDLHADAVLIRKIKRIQRAKELEEEEAEDGERNRSTQHNATFIGDDEDGTLVDDIIEDRVIPGTQMKAERMASALPQSTAPKSSAAVVTLGSSSNDEEEEEEEEEDADEDEDDTMEE